jgi:hypothetical protein
LCVDSYCPPEQYICVEDCGLIATLYVILACVSKSIGVQEVEIGLTYCISFATDKVGEHIA